MKIHYKNPDPAYKVGQQSGGETSTRNDAECIQERGKDGPHTSKCATEHIYFVGLLKTWLFPKIPTLLLLL